ncbi:fused MFS/spermidine synthase [Caldisericum exile]|uniref:Polyamine aminopropyltransferase n=1 Tax=Caldisericum exile (strain DSM 21853 / NBRC 104410 / AZM16c01) TaxID=511051 RepID=A0A7U6GDY4_CALEA|nr:fused MFS/spermidine synthase [Caldisericum exile]BAL80621.1 putative spermidine synthase [Caldisericum exile AZM16c01]
MEKNYLYFHDRFGGAEEHLHGVRRIIYEVRTPYQFIQVVESPTFGKMLIIDGDVQSSLVDEYIYHESLVHPALLTAHSPKVVVILGGGEGSTLREILKHKSVTKAIMVDIDKDATDIAKEYMKEWHQGAFDDQRATLINSDARAFVESNLSNNSVDVFISDLTEPYEGGPSYKLYSVEFYKTIFDRLKEDGVFVLQASLLRVTNYKMHTIIRNTLKQVFPIVRSYFAYVPAFDTTWGFIIASKKNDPKTFTKEDVDYMIKERITGDLRFYDGETHIALFNLPKDIRKLIETETEVITDLHYIPLERKENL